MSRRILVGLVDSGLSPDLAAYAHLSRGFGTADVTADAIGHGSALARLMLEAAPTVRFLNAQVFRDRPTTSADQVAQAVDWVVALGGSLVLLSLGLRDDRPSLRHACLGALARGVLVVASVPARGQPVFPSSYPGVIRASGDARCAPGQVSWFDGIFGACPRADDGSGRAGASFAAARVAGLLAQAAAKGHSDPAATLRSAARFVGRERKVAADGAPLRSG